MGFWDYILNANQASIDLVNRYSEHGLVGTTSLLLMEHWSIHLFLFLVPSL